MRSALHYRGRSRWAKALRRTGLAAGVVVVAAGVGGTVQLSRALPPVRTRVVLGDRLKIAGAVRPWPWPGRAAAAVQVQGLTGVVGVGTERVMPLASVTKLVTALVVLKAHPLATGQSGPTVTVTASDAAGYAADVAGHQSVVPIKAGEQLSELQALEGMLIPSANNVARLLARWVAGSIPPFVTSMNQEAQSLGLTRTHLVGPAGLNPGSVGTAADLVRLAGDVMANPVLRRIVAMPQVTLPVAGTVYNYDYALGHDGVVGIKTGSSGPAGGNFVFAAHRRVDGRRLTVLGAVLGEGGVQPLQRALDEGERLATAALSPFGRVTVLPAGRAVFEIAPPWGHAVTAVTGRSAAFLAAPGQTVELTVQPGPVMRSGDLTGLRSGETLGTVELRCGSQTVTVPVVASGPLPKVPVKYRLERL